MISKFLLKIIFINLFINKNRLLLKPAIYAILNASLATEAAKTIALYLIIVIYRILFKFTKSFLK
jgi:hypothetical protein